jgi:hypothetical protein
MSVRMGVNVIADRWKRVARALPGEDRVRAERIVAMAKRHSSELFYGLDDPLEAAVFSVLVEILKEMEREQPRADGGGAGRGGEQPGSEGDCGDRAGWRDPGAAMTGDPPAGDYRATEKAGAGGMSGKGAGRGVDP